MIPGECSVCAEVYDEEEDKPRCLPCGHTYCTICIDCMVKHGYVECPDCHVQHEGTSAAQFPVNHGILALMKEFGEFELYPATKKMKTLEEPTSSVSQKAGTLYQEEVSEASKKELKKRVAALKREYREMRRMGFHLSHYQSQLNVWQEEHMQSVEKLYNLLEENKSFLFILEHLHSRIVAHRAEGQLGKQKLYEVLGRMENVTTPLEAMEVIGQAQLCTQEAGEWAKQSKALYPDVDALFTHIKVGNHSSIFSP